MSKFEQSQRILNVQTPVIPVVGTLIRENPGTISLGQGVVYYGPPQEALDAYVDFIAEKFRSEPDFQIGATVEAA